MSQHPGDSVFATLGNLLRSPQATPFSGYVGTFMARDALALAGRYLDLTAGDTVLLPTYLCKEVLRPYAGTSRLLFYDVGDDLAVDPDTIMRWLGRERIRLLVIINYFGFLQPHRHEIARVCAERQTVLLEDCAHSLLTTGSGEAGDLSVVSYRKLLPVFDGGGLTIRTPRPGFAVPYHPRVYSDALSVLATVKALTHFRSDALSRAGVADWRSTSAGGATTPPRGRVLPLSWFTSNGAANAPLANIIERRRRDYEFWHELVMGSSGLTPVMPDLGEGVCPLGFPATLRERDGVNAALNDVGVPARIHWRLPHDIGADCPNSHRLSRQMITLPVYPELTDGAKARAADVLNRVRGR